MLVAIIGTPAGNSSTSHPECLREIPPHHGPRHRSRAIAALHAFLGLSERSARGRARTQTLDTPFDSSTGFGLSPSNPGGIAPYVAVGFEWNPLDQLAVTVDYRVQRFNVDADVFLSPTRVSFDLDASGIGIGMAWRTPPHPGSTH